MFPLKIRKLIRGAEAHIKAGLGAGADYVADRDDLFAPFDGVIENYFGLQGGNWSRLKRPNGDNIEFAHLSKYYKVGPVKEGERIALTGNTGTITTGPHLHVQILRVGKRLDPETYNWENMNITYKIKVISNRTDSQVALDMCADWYKSNSGNRINLQFLVEPTDLQIPFKDGQVDSNWYDLNVLPKALGYDIAILLLDRWDGTTGSGGKMTGDSEQKTMKIQLLQTPTWGEYNFWAIAHEISHVCFYLTVGEPKDPTHQLFSGDSQFNRDHAHKIFEVLDYKILSDTLIRRRKEQQMSNAVFAKRAGTDEFGFYLPATTVESLKDKALNLGREDLIRPDGSIDFTKAKEVTGL